MTGKALGGLCLFLLLVSGYSQAQVVSAEIDKTQAQIDDIFQYTLTINGSAERDPELPEIDGIEIQSTGKSSSFSIINGSMSRESIYTYILTPLRPGQFVIPSLKIKVGGKVEETLAIRFEVLDHGHSGTQAGTPIEARPPLFIERDVEPKDVFVGEPIKSTVRIFHRVNLHDADLQQKTQTSFLRYQAEGQKEYAKTIGQETYRVIELREVYVPLEGGTFELPAFTLKAKISQQAPARSRRGNLLDQFFGNSPFGGGDRFVQRSLSSEPVSVKVKPLPKGAPAGFAGLVGNYQLEASLSRHSLDVGETSTLTLVLRGNGNGELGQTPKWSLPAAIKVYDDKPQLKRTLDEAGELQIVNTYKLALVPTSPGTFELGTLSIPVFVPSLGQYIQLSAQGGQLEVRGAAVVPEEKNLSPERKEVNTLKLDLVDVRKGKRLYSRGQFGKAEYSLASLILGLSLITLIGAWVFHELSKRKSDLSRKKKKKRALAHLKAGLAHLDKLSPDLAELMNQKWRLFFEDYLGDDLSAMTGPELLRYLKGRQLSDPTLLGEIELIEQSFARSRYGAAPLDAKVLSDELIRIAEKVVRI